MNRMYSKKIHILIFLLPALALFCGVLIAPIGASAYYSLFDWNGFGPKTFIGFSNYKELFCRSSCSSRWLSVWPSRWAKRSRASASSSLSISCPS